MTWVPPEGFEAYLDAAGTRAFQRRHEEFSTQKKAIERDHAARGMYRSGARVAAVDTARENFLGAYYTDVARTIVEAITELSVRVNADVREWAFGYFDRKSTAEEGRTRAGLARSDLRIGLDRLVFKGAAAPVEAPPETLDALTALPVRDAYNKDIAVAVEEASADQPLSLLFVDIDHFKLFNDQHGHQTGDEVLGAVARAADDATRRKGRAYRWGGEELAVILPNHTTDEAAQVAERVRQAVASTRVGEKALAVTVSIGLATCPGDVEPGAKELADAADRALYVAKHAGRDRVMRFDRTSGSD
jgi:diguanylate cyclase (GGDEF)-like protein